MPQLTDNTLEARIRALEERVQSMQSAAAVGGTTVAAVNDGSVTLTGVAGSSGGVPWNTTAGPEVDLFVTGGRVRVDVAASFEVYGNKCSLFAGYRVIGPTPTNDPISGLPDFTGALTVRAPDYAHAAELQDDGTGMNQLGAFATFDLVTGLDTGWYRITEAYALSYSGTTGAPYGIATDRRLAVTRY